MFNYEFWPPGKQLKPPCLLGVCCCMLTQSRTFKTHSAENGNLLTNGLQLQNPVCLYSHHEINRFSPPKSPKCFFGGQQFVDLERSG